MRVKRRLSAYPAATLQHLGLVIAFVLLVAARGFAGAHPALSSILVFVFCLPYLIGSLVTKRSSLLYPTMLLGAVSYFLACHAFGAPGASFPLLSVPLVVCLELIGQRLKKRLSEELHSYPRTVFRAMNITVAVFTGWALLQAGGLMSQPGMIRWVAGLTFLGYAGLYLAHSLVIGPSFYIYVFSAFLGLGGIFAAAASGPVEYHWIPCIVAAALVLFVGTRHHAERGYVWSRHFYFSSAGLILFSLVFAIFRWSFLLIDLAVASFLLWLAYGWLAKAVSDVRAATMAERVVAKYLFLCSLVLAIPIVPVIFVRPWNLHVILAALVCGLTFSWIAWRRRSDVGVWGRTCTLAAVMFASAGLLGLGGQLSGWAMQCWSLAGPIVLLAGLGLLYVFLAKKEAKRLANSLGLATIFPVFFAWYIPMVGGELLLALPAAAAAGAGAVLLALRLREKNIYGTLGPGIAGIVVAGGLLVAGTGLASWVAFAVCAAVAGACYVWAGSSDRPVTRIAGNLCWLILSCSSIVMAAMSGLVQVLYCMVAVGVTAVLIAGQSRPQRKPDVLDRLVQILAMLGTIGVMVVGPLSSQGMVLAGACVLILSLAHFSAWGFSRGVWSAHVANGLFAWGYLLVILGTFSSIEAILASGVALVLALFVLAVVMRRGFAEVSRGASLVGHLSCITLACVGLIQVWSLSNWYIPLAAAPYLVLYAVMPKLRDSTGFRVGTILWLSFAVMLCLAAFTGGFYHQQMLPMAMLSLVWLAAGYVLNRGGTEAWSVPLYVCAAVLAVFCGLVSLFGPGVEGSWGVFLINGIVFACLFLILRQDVFAYLITLALCLMAFDWVKASTSSFTQDVLFYLVIGAAVLGSFFLLPHLRKLVGRMTALPMISIFTWRGAFIIALPILGLAMLVLSAYSIKITGHPKFCTSCHNMGDYYASWQHSAHGEVPCIDCHYEPGVTATVKGKVEGMVQLFKYVSHSYGKQPHAMISNESCMRSGCHETMEDSEETLLFRGQVRFRHDKHLEEHPRGKVLNCVSCHGQTVEGQHINVTETTCLTCHFYGRGTEAVAAGECMTCHIQPEKTVSFMGQSFNHREFLAGKESVECSHCHSQVTQGDGAVSGTRCQSCHRHSIEEVQDQAQFHLVHVSKGHFDCLQCHDEIKHGIHPMEQQLLASGNCHTCHAGERHSLQERIYAGTALPELESVPDAMYKAGVACDGCHTDVQSDGLAGVPFTKKLSGEKQCAECHGSKMYGSMLVSWQEETRERLGELRPSLEQLRQTCENIQVPAEELAKAQYLLNSAKTKLLFVVEDGSYGAHNITYVTSVLDSAEAEIEKCRSLVTSWTKAAVEESAE